MSEIELFGCFTKGIAQMVSPQRVWLQMVSPTKSIGNKRYRQQRVLPTKGIGNKGYHLPKLIQVTIILEFLFTKLIFYISLQKK